MNYIELISFTTKLGIIVQINQTKSYTIKSAKLFANLHMRSAFWRVDERICVPHSLAKRLVGDAELIYTTDGYSNKRVVSITFGVGDDGLLSISGYKLP